MRDTNNANRKKKKKLRFKKITPFRSSISKISNTFRDFAEDIDIVIPKYNLQEYSDNYSMTSETLWNYYRNEIDDDVI